MCAVILILCLIAIIGMTIALVLLILELAVDLHYSGKGMYDSVGELSSDEYMESHDEDIGKRDAYHLFMRWLKINVFWG